MLLSAAWPLDGGAGGGGMYTSGGGCSDIGAPAGMGCVGVSVDTLRCARRLK
jgi:hypothetical protein